MPAEIKTDAPKERLTVRDGVWYKCLDVEGKPESRRVVEKGYYCANGV